MELTFRKVNLNDKPIIFQWLAQPHVMAFWDNTQAHKDDIINFMHGRKEPSDYCNGEFEYWLGCVEATPFAMIMTIHDDFNSPIDDIKVQHLSKLGHTYGLDFMIGALEYVGKGLASITLEAFIDFFRANVNPKADTFMIDPQTNNPKAKHVYMKAGFEYVADFMMEGDTSGAGQPHHLLVKRFMPEVKLMPATMQEYPMVQNMARFYVYELSRECGCLSKDWNLPHDGMYQSIDLKPYFEDTERKAYLIKVYDEVAGFIMINQATFNPANLWHMGEFFILAKYQRQDVGRMALNQLWPMVPGLWEVSVIPQNQSALKFWQQVLSEQIGKQLTPEIKEVDYDKSQPKRYVFSFRA